MTREDPVRMDLHVHSRHSFDAKGSVLELAMTAQRAGLWGFALTDHDTRDGWAEVAEAQAKTGMLIIPSIEVSTAHGHVLALGAEGPVPKGKGFLETLEAIEAVGGVPVPSHPLRMRAGVGPTRLRRAAEAGRIGCVEARNARDRQIVQDNTARLAQDLDLATIGGTDAHWINDIGTAWTAFEEPHERVEDVLEALCHGRCHGGGGTLPRARVWGHGATVPIRMVRGLRRR